MRIINFARVIIVANVLWLLSACCQPKVLGDYKQDSVRVEVVENIVYVPDTIIHEVPLIKEVRSVRDTASHLSNIYADSWAVVSSDGILSHTLQTRPQQIKLPYSKTEKHRDSIVYRNVYREVKVEVAKPLSWWQQTQIRGFWACLIFIAVFSAIRWVKSRFLA